TRRSSLLIRRRPRATLFPYTTLFRSRRAARAKSHTGTVFVSTVTVGIACRGNSFETKPTLAGEDENGTSRRSMDLSGSGHRAHRSEEHTSELQSPYDLVCRLLLEKKK